MESKVKCNDCGGWIGGAQRMYCGTCMSKKVERAEGRMRQEWKEEVDRQLREFYGLVRKYLEDQNKYNRMMLERWLP